MGNTLPKAAKLFGLDFTNIFQYPTGNFSSSTEIREKSGIFPCIINSGIPVSFSGLSREGKWASLEWLELDRTGSGPVLNAWDREFPIFFWKKSGSQEMAFGNSDL